MTQQASTPDALRLAQWLESLPLELDHDLTIAAELRRQHAKIERLHSSLACEKRMRKDAEEDAERYQWLTHDGERIGERMRGTLDAWDGCDGKAGFDVAIDAAMRDAPNV